MLHITENGIRIKREKIWLACCPEEGCKGEVFKSLIRHATLHQSHNNHVYQDMPKEIALKVTRKIKVKTEKSNNQINLFGTTKSMDVS